MAMVSKKGSRLVKIHREQAERKKASKKEWELAGSKLGNLLGIQKENDKEQRDADDQLDHRDNQKFADHMKVDQEKKSEFAKQKSIKQQREYLPVFAVRQQLLNIIRDNRHGCQMAIARFLESYVFGHSGFWTMAPLRYAAKFDAFLSLDCAPTPSTPAQSKERKGSNFAIWQPCYQPAYIPAGQGEPVPLRGQLHVGDVPRALRLQPRLLHRRHQQPDPGRPAAVRLLALWRPAWKYQG